MRVGTVTGRCSGNAISEVEDARVTRAGLAEKWIKRARDRGGLKENRAIRRLIAPATEAHRTHPVVQNIPDNQRAGMIGRAVGPVRDIRQPVMVQVCSGAYTHSQHLSAPRVVRVRIR